MDIDPALIDIMDYDTEIWGTDVTPIKAAHAIDPRRRRRTALQDQERRHMRSLVAKAYPLLLSGERDIEVPPETIHSLVVAIANGLNGRGRRRSHQYLVKCLEQGVKKCGWKLPIPSPYITLPHTPSLFSPKKFTLLPELRVQEVAFIESLTYLDPRRPESGFGVFKPNKLTDQSCVSRVMTGQLMFCAVRYGGLIKPELLDAFLHAVPQWDGSLLTQSTLSLELGTQDSLTPMRWYPDPLTTILILRFKASLQSGQLEMPTEGWKPLLRCFLRNLKTLGARVSTSVESFLEAATVACCLERRAFMAQWMMGKTASSSWPVGTERRVRLGERLKAKNFPEEPTEAPIPLDARMYTQQIAAATNDVLKAYKAVLQCFTLPKRHGWQTELVQALRIWLRNYGDGTGLVPSLLVHWLIAIAERRCPTHEAVASSESVHTYLTRIGRSMFLGSLDFDTVNYSETESWIELYQCVVNDKRGKIARRNAILQCHSFHAFVSRQLNIPHINVAAEFGLFWKRGERCVNANYISPAEFAHAVSLLMETDGGHLYKEILNLAYWSGLRISEITGLLLSDIRILKIPRSTATLVELVVSTNRKRRLKTYNSHRIVPLSLLMPAKRLKDFLAYYDRRVAETRGKYHDERIFLFASPGTDTNLPEIEPVRRYVQEGLRRVTGDKTLTFQHLRHSAANNWLLMLAAQGADDPVWTLFGRPPEELLEIANAFRNKILFNDHNERRILYAVAGLLGHASPDTTLGSYLHVISWLAEIELRRDRPSSRYHTLQRSIVLDSVMLQINQESARVWRQYHDRESLYPLIDRMSKIAGVKKSNQVNPVKVHNYGKLHLSALTNLAIPSPYQIYEAIWLSVIQNRSPANIAEQVRLPVELVKHILKGARAIGSMQSRSRWKVLRLSTDTRYFKYAKRGHKKSVDLSRHPVIPGYIPALPHLRRDREDMELFWKRFTESAAFKKTWNTYHSESPVTRSKIEDALYRGMRAFARQAHAYGHDIKLYDGQLQEVTDYVRLLGRFFPKNRIIIHVRPHFRYASDVVLKQVKKLFNTPGIIYEVGKPIKFARSGWRYGRFTLKLIRDNTTGTTKIAASYGAWFAQYCTVLMLASLGRDGKLASTESVTPK